MKYNIVVATHHKTGTVWMSTVFKAIAQDIGATYVDFWSQQDELPQALKTPFILFNYHSVFPRGGDVLDRADVRILHLIRDPRDVLISAMHYHKKSNESWLHEPVPGYDKLTYQRRLNALPTLLEQYVFEMENSTDSTLRDMRTWRYGRANCLEARYEELRQDTQMARWSQIMAFLGLDAAEQQAGRQRFFQNSLFGNVAARGHKHIRSGDVAQWRREFTPELAAAFAAKFPDVLRTLGYEPDDKWIGDLQQPEANRIGAVLKRLVGRR